MRGPYCADRTVAHASEGGSNCFRAGLEVVNSSSSPPQLRMAISLPYAWSTSIRLDRAPSAAEFPTYEVANSPVATSRPTSDDLTRTLPKSLGENFLAFQDCWPLL
jgi:hypothetical protein